MPDILPVASNSEDKPDDQEDEDVVELNKSNDDEYENIDGS